MMAERKSKSFLGDWAIGCLIQIVVVLVLAAVFKDRLSSIMFYAIMFSFTSPVIRFVMHKRGICGGLFDKLLGPGLLCLSILLSFIHPVDIGEKNPDSGDGDKTNVETSAPENSPETNVNDCVTNEIPTVTLEEALSELDELVGLESVKAEVRKIANTVKIAQARKAAGMKTAPMSYHMVFTGNPGTGKTTVARIMAKIFRALGVLEKGQLIETDRSGLISGYQGQTGIKVNEVVDSALGGVLFIDEAYALTDGEKSDSYGNEAIATLLKRMEDDRDRLIVIVAGYTDEMRDFINANPGLKSRFNRYLEFPDYTADELAEMFRRNVKKNQYRLSADAEEALDKTMADLTRKRDRQFGNGRFVRNLFEKAVERQSERLAALSDISKDDLATLTLDDLQLERPIDPHRPKLEDALAELDELVGMEPVKAEVKKLAAYCKMAKERQAQGLDVTPMSYHFVFTGNPGTGKTTVARIIAKVFRALGILDRGHLVETDRSGLVADYMGQTATKTNRKIDEALDGILFIDEAYSLVGEGNDTYGKEALTTLLKRMEDDRERLVVIVAGYTDEMKKFMDANSGLQSRFARQIEFPDYSTAELAEMFRRTVKKNKYVLSADSEKWLTPAIGLWTKDRDRKFGNGRYVRNLFEKTLERQALRLAEIDSPTKEQLVTITLHDIGISLKDPDASAED